MDASQRRGIPHRGDHCQAAKRTAAYIEGRRYGPGPGPSRGGTVAFNFTDPSGAVVDERAVTRDASAAGISLRTGCFCNPGAGESAFGLSQQDLGGEWWHGGPRRDLRTIDDYLELAGLPSGGAVRVSLGLVSNLGDVERFLDFAERTRPSRWRGVQALSPRRPRGPRRPRFPVAALGVCLRHRSQWRRHAYFSAANRGNVGNRLPYAQVRRKARFPAAHPFELALPRLPILLLPRPSGSTLTSCLRAIRPSITTSATLVGHSDELQAGTVLIFEEVVGPNTGDPEDANPNNRWAVRLTGVQLTDYKGQPLVDPLNGQPIAQISWAPEDALPFPLCISSTTDASHGSQALTAVSVARGNIVPADHGIWQQQELAGTVSLTSGSETVTGSGTIFPTVLQVGQWLVFSSDATQTPYQIAAVASDTSLTLASPYAGASAFSTTAAIIGLGAGSGGPSGSGDGVKLCLHVRGHSAHHAAPVLSRAGQFAGDVRLSADDRIYRHAGTTASSHRDAGQCRSGIGLPNACFRRYVFTDSTNCSL